MKKVTVEIKTFITRVALTKRQPFAITISEFRVTKSHTHIYSNEIRKKL